MKTFVAEPGLRVLDTDEIGSDQNRETSFKVASAVREMFFSSKVLKPVAGVEVNAGAGRL